MTGPLVPFREIVLKVHSRCDLACDHCYIYEHADQSWRTRPKAISDEAISWTALRLAEHAKSHALPSVSVILHGGEPLLAGPARLRHICEELTKALDGVAGLDLRIHTNGLQLSPRYLDLFSEYDVKVGISLDGDRSANDRHRRFADGRTSHPLVLRAVDLLRQERYRHLYLGLLCTIDVANDPMAVYDALTELEPPGIDFLLPHATWDDPPPRPDGSATAYADWILTVFDRWDQQGRGVPVRLFASVLSTLDGGPSLTESLGLAPTDLVVVETDGTLEQVDSLKSAYEGAAATGFDVYAHPFDEVAAHPGVRARQQGLAGVSETCRRCPVVRSCGGGLYTHRYSSRNDFDNTSVYCTDLEALIRGIERRTAAATVSAAITDPGVLMAEHQDVTRTLLADVHLELAGQGGEVWDEAWELASVLEGRSDALDVVLGHPYTYTWLQDCLAALREERPEAAGLALRLQSYLAAAVVRAGLEVPVRAPYRNGRLWLPTLGELRLTEPGEYGEAEVRAAEKGFLVHVDGREPRYVRADEESGGWRPVRTLGGDGVPALRLDDLDPYRDCFGAPVRERLGSREVDGWSGRLAEAWQLLRQTVPAQAMEAADCLTTLTPLVPGEVSVGRHGFGALGIALPGTPEELATALLRGFRRAKLHALAEVTDLYAQDGWWTHRAPWRAAPMPLSELLAGVYERVGLAAFEPAAAEQARPALETLGRAAELTVSGRRLLEELWKESESH
ncbi:MULTISPECIES: radical SAM/SPASM protein FxsBH, inactivated beta-hydroxylase extension form [unclassified Streptomyces]|uniref:radical SAM/SPASM protein FxsBH, inactivated beta-hydroxylase extension form n=1 Tax=unclassified Streptomyces TaxID=2593676 RepID=UPI002DDC0756|nr:radical SAM/SPASM protein FxsB, inactivated metallohydrolase extension form [Streptomyces sp. NBC_01750]WSB03661.1 radical SAM/SPASM protein FxsB, inactivated metallohydrolase extension form [Streptomyces sp. NBC_01794]WSD32051.1 radical SAM/SPASM protein FxsB, inactivated metallohydrolase extension form [Streptomyces sp. NBC_01750]